MRRKRLTFLALGLLLLSAASAQTPSEKKAPSPAKAPLPMDQLVEAMTQRLANSLQVKTVVGDPIKAGQATLVPIIMIDVGFGGGGTMPPQAPDQGGKGFYMSGEARPLGFIVITKSGTKFVSVGKVPRN
ncbi:MAG: spore germination protein GerW family protein [Candidatus Aminicenantes bacterium]|nr:spore germination protein GerW family protein [Candidatus Aminicenantes bacterium]